MRACLMGLWLTVSTYKERRLQIILIENCNREIIMSYNTIIACLALFNFTYFLIRMVTSSPVFFIIIIEFNSGAIKIELDNTM